MVQAAKKRKIFDNRYEILSIVGRGAASVVYHAKHINAANGEVALKVLLNDKEQKSSGEKLRKEALALVSSKHKYVVRLDDFHSVGELCYLSMEYAPESDLRKFNIKNSGKLPPIQAELFLLQILDALSYMHCLGIIHRDIKPDNILVISPKEVRLADFGVAVIPGDTANLEDLRRGVGTMDYMAPEVLEGKNCSEQTDLYALAVSFYELISGVHPLANLPIAQQLEGRQDGKIINLKAICPEIPEYISQVIMRALLADPQRRFGSARDMAQAILVNRAATEMPLHTNESKINLDKLFIKSDVSATPPVTALHNEKPTQEAELPKVKSETQSPNTKLSLGAKLLEAVAKSGFYANQTKPIEIADKPILTGSLVETSPSPAESKVQPSQISNDTASAQIQPSTSSAVTETIILKAQDLSTAKTDQQLTSKPSLLAAAKALAQAKANKTKIGPGNVSNNITNTAQSGSILSTQVITKDLVQQVRQEAANSNPSQAIPQQAQTDLTRQANAAHVAQAAMIDKASITRKKAIFLSTSTFLLLMLLYYGNIFLIKKYNIGIAKSYMVPENHGLNSPLPKFKQQTLDFPALPSGTYTGSITGLVANQESPLTIISLEEQGKLVVLVGLAGWKPAVVNIRNSDDHNNTARLASNGLIFEMQGKTLTGAISGSLLNIMTGQSSSWQVKPVL